MKGVSFRGMFSIPEPIQQLMSIKNAADRVLVLATDMQSKTAPISVDELKDMYKVVNDEGQNLNSM